MRITSRVVAELALVAVLAAPASVASAADGTICIAPVTAQMRKEDRGDPRGMRPRYNFDFSVQIDSGARIRVPEEKALALHGLDLEKRHLVRIRDGNKVIESFRFAFESRGADVLCLWYGPWYETWSLSPPGRRPWCKCK